MSAIGNGFDNFAQIMVDPLNREFQHPRLMLLTSVVLACLSGFLLLGVSVLWRRCHSPDVLNDTHAKIAQIFCHTVLRQSPSIQGNRNSFPPSKTAVHGMRGEQEESKSSAENSSVLNIAQSPLKQMTSSTPFQSERLKKSFDPKDWEQLLQLNKQLEELYDEARTEQGQKNLKTIYDRNDQLLLQKVALINRQKISKSDKVLALTFSGRIPKNTVLIHASSSVKNLNNILTQGIRQTISKEQAEGRFGENELGQGLYVSQTGGYAGEGFAYALSLQTIKEITTVRVPYKRSLIRQSVYKPLALDEESITMAFTALELGCNVIQRDGVPPRDEECVIRTPTGLKPTYFLQLEQAGVTDKWVHLKGIEGTSLHTTWISQ